MAIEIKVPTVGESISEVTLVKWLKKEGEWANRDEVIAELESEKATFELNAEQAGANKNYCPGRCYAEYWRCSLQLLTPMQQSPKGLRLKKSPLHRK